LLAIAGFVRAGALITFDSPPSGLVVNNFIQGSAVNPASEITNQFENLGVILSRAGPTGAPYAVLVDLSGQAPSGTNGIGGANSSNFLDYTQDLDIFLVVPGTTTPAVTDMISIQGDLIPIPGNVISTAYDINGNLIASGTQPDSAGGVYSLTAPGIHEFRLHSESGTVAYDNLSFDTPAAPSGSASTAPEPSTLAFIGLGIAVMGTRRLRGLFTQRSDGITRRANRRS
jgi:hypothetical protein